MFHKQYCKKPLKKKVMQASKLEFNNKTISLYLIIIN